MYLGYFLAKLFGTLVWKQTALPK